MMSRFAAIVIAISVALALAGCGSTSQTASNSPPPSTPTNPGTTSPPPAAAPAPSPSPSPTPPPAPPPVPTPTPSPTPTPTPSPTPTPTPTPAPDNYQAAIFFLVGRTTNAVGTLNMNATANDGNMKLQIDGDCGGANANLILDLWPFGATSSQQQVQVGTFSADANSKVNATFQFPQKGNFAGFFDIYVKTASGPDLCLASGPDPFDPGLSYSSPLLPASSISGGIGAPTGAASGSGAVAVTGNSAQVSLKNAAAANNFSVNLCGSTMDHCTNIGTLTTDAQGNASGAFSMNGTGEGGNFVLTDSAGAEYVSGFHVQ